MCRSERVNGAHDKFHISVEGAIKLVGSVFRGFMLCFLSCHSVTVSSSSSELRHVAQAQALSFLS